MDVVLLLNAVRRLGMVELGNSRISDGTFHASIGVLQLNLSTFLNAMNLGHAAGTWRNKLSDYFRIKALYQFSQYHGDIIFQDPAHTAAWKTVCIWMANRDQMLAGGHYTTTRYGNTQLRPMLQTMVQEMQAGECRFF